MTNEEAPNPLETAKAPRNVLDEGAVLDDYQKMTLALHAKAALEARHSPMIASVSRAFGHAMRDLASIVRNEGELRDHPITRVFMLTLAGMSAPYEGLCDDCKTGIAACEALASSYDKMKLVAASLGS